MCISKEDVLITTVLINLYVPIAYDVMMTELFNLIRMSYFNNVFDVIFDVLFSI